MVVITKNFVTECLLEVQTSFESICGKNVQLKSLYGWMDKTTKREKILFTYEVQCIDTKKI